MSPYDICPQVEGFYFKNIITKVMQNTNTNIETMDLNPEVSATLKKYNSAIDGALAAAQKLESICVTAHLAEMFWVSESETAKTMQKDYLMAA